LQDFGGVVGGTAVYDPIFKERVILRQDAFDGGLDEMALVKGRGNDGDERLGGHDSSVKVTVTSSR
jgi:hypothetical protein